MTVAMWVLSARFSAALLNLVGNRGAVWTYITRDQPFPNLGDC
jgi:hypothetical protein